MSHESHQRGVHLRELGAKPCCPGVASCLRGTSEELELKLEVRNLLSVVTVTRFPLASDSSCMTIFKSFQLLRRNARRYIMYAVCFQSNFRRGPLTRSDVEIGIVTLTSQNGQGRIRASPLFAKQAARPVHISLCRPRY